MQKVVLQILTYCKMISEMEGYYRVEHTINDVNDFVKGEFVHKKDIMRLTFTRRQIEGERRERDS